MSSILKLAWAVLALTCTIQAIPVRRHCTESECSQSVGSSNVNLGSTTNIVPVTQVTPITRFQPIIQSYAPIVESEASCEQSPAGLVFAGPLHHGYMLPSMGPAFEPMWGSDRFRYNVDLIDRLSRLRFLRRMEYLRSNPAIINNSGIINRVEKRHVAPECVPSATETCEQSLATSTTDMGSVVKAIPSTVVLPSTVYQGHVKAKEAQVYAAAAQHTDLKQSDVNLGSNVYIQPATKVIPKTTYQPSVDQKATVVEMAAPENESLARSSVSLGSTVTIRPVTTIEPLTIYQPEIKSLPFIIHDETGCETEIVP
ncbi:hypothetical protein EDD21DRAFT_416052 [Dissophora ornata]|nr:hypothetical protein BGZ58_007304 [Dissophora ornata]KAI8600238.1 hypothetical protein EDD21DRAFT_416052 [Dissophora ornata]